MPSDDPGSRTGEALLTVERLCAFYGDFQALFDATFAVGAGETLALIGANGAGKSTLLRSLLGLVRSRAAAAVFAGRPLAGRPTREIVRAGISLVPEGRRLFPSLSVEENLLMGRGSGRSGPWDLARVYGLFPVLRERRRQPGTSLSGGQQQMVAIGRALLANPVLLLCDEISLGLAPAVVKEMYAALARVGAEGTTLVVVEQDLNQALAAASRVLCLRGGRVVLAGAHLTRDAIAAAYFGV